MDTNFNCRLWIADCGFQNVDSGLSSGECRVGKSIRNPKSKIRNSKSGQSLIEFCIGLVGMLAVIGGIFQLGILGQARTDARVDATRAATARSMLDSEMTGAFVPRFIRAMDEGDDGFMYSVDDFAIGGSADQAFDRMASGMQPELLHRFAPGSSVAGMTDPLEMMLGMGLVSGHGMQFNIPVMPIARRLFFNRGSVDIHVQVWMTRTGEIY